MNIQQKIASTVILTILLIVIPASFYGFRYLQNAIIDREIIEQLSHTDSQLEFVSRHIAKIEPRLEHFVRLVQEEVAKPNQHDEVEHFHQTMTLDADGIWRNKRALYNGTTEAGIFFPDGLSDEQKILHMRIKHVMDIFGAITDLENQNLWYLSADRTEVIFDRSFPEFVFEQAADNDYTNTPWVTLTLPDTNPEREFVFTPPLFDPVPQKWMISGLYPLYVNDKWLGSIGIDLQLSSVVSSLMSNLKKYPNSLLFLKDSHDHFILAGDMQALLETDPDHFNDFLRAEKELDNLIRNAVNLEGNKTVLLHRSLSYKNNEYIALATQFDGVNWPYYELIRIDDILEPSRNVLATLLLTSLMVSFAIGIIISVNVDKNIGQRVRRLTQAIRSYQNNNENTFKHNLDGEDEIAIAAREFDSMSGRLERQMVEIQRTHDLIRQSEQRWKLALEGVGDGVWDWNIETNEAEFSANWKGMLGFENDEFENTFERWAEHLHPEDLPIAKQKLDDYLAGRAKSYRVEFRMRCKDGSWKWILSRGFVISRNRDLNPSRMIGTHTDISAQKEIEFKIQQGSDQLIDMLNLSPVAVRITDSNRRVLYANTAYRELIEIQGTLDNIDPWDYYTNKNDYREILDEIERGKQVRNKLLQISVYDRGDKWVLASYARIEHYGENAVLGWFYDITDRLQSEESLRLHASVFDNAWEAIIISDADNHIITVNNAFTAITGFSLEDIKGQNPCFLCSELRGEEFYKTMWKTVTEEGQWHGEIWSKKKNGDIFAQRTSVSAVRNPQSDITHYVTVFNDISDIKEKESKLRALAHYDALTGLPNRVLLADRLAQCIANTRRNNKLLLVCFLDLDGFKAINDHHGHDVGDKLLIEIATRLENTVRKGDTVARLGGDEFVVLLNSVNQHDEIDVLLCRINDVIAKPVQIDEHQHHVSGSIGVTIYPNDDSDTDTLLRHADLAMYEAKQAGRNRYHIFDATLDLEIHQKHQDVVRIAQALAANEFCLYYQPKVNLLTHEVIGMEALIRWNHPERGILGPFDFLPMIENNDLIVKIGDWVIEQALAHILAWQEQGTELEVSVNVSARQVQDDMFIPKLQNALEKFPQIDSHLLELELLETSALETLEAVKIVMETGKVLGVSFALDDFGTGYSSLSYLKKLPAKTLKIDQTFVRDMLVDLEDQAIVEGIIKLANVFGREVIAEGVETDQHGQRLIELGCIKAQGYGISRPMPFDDVLPWIARYQK